MAKTYDLITSSTLGSPATGIDFTSIPSTYTDLRLIVTGVRVSGGALNFRFNNDSGSNYFYERAVANGSSLGASVNGATTSIGTNGWNSTYPQIWIMDILRYSGTTKKSSIMRMAADESGGGEMAWFCATYNVTTAISQINMFISAGTIAAGFTASLYGILRA
jgi:hypothetical protein